MPSHDRIHFRGGKGRSFREIINLMPPHSRYIETHLGGGAVLRHKRPAVSSIGIEIDPAVVRAWSNRSVGHTTIINGECVDVLRGLDIGPDDLVYSDPPYVADSRRRRRCYRFDYTDEMHIELVGLLRTLPCPVILSGYPSALYDRLLPDWHRTDYVAATRRGPATESAWTNFRPGPPLHDYSYAGRDFRQRETIRRRRRRIADVVLTSDPLTMHAALADLADAHPRAVMAAAERIAR